MKGDLDCALPFNDCRLHVKRENDWKCATKTKCQPMKYHNGTIKHFWCSTAENFHGDWHNYGICEESCPKETDYLNQYV